MIVLLAGKAYSTLYGYDGSREVRALMKKLRLDRSALKNEGNPLSECLALPFRKAESLRANGTREIDVGAFAEIQKAKQPSAPFKPTLDIGGDYAD